MLAVPLLLRRQDLVRFGGNPNSSPLSRMYASSCGENKSEGLRPLLVWHLTIPSLSAIGAKEIWGQWSVFLGTNEPWRIRQPFVLPSRYPSFVMLSLSYSSLHPSTVRLLYTSVFVQLDSMILQTRSRTSAASTLSNDDCCNAIGKNKFSFFNKKGFSEKWRAMPRTHSRQTPWGFFMLGLVVTRFSEANKTWQFPSSVALIGYKSFEALY